MFRLQNRKVRPILHIWLTWFAFIALKTDSRERNTKEPWMDWNGNGCICMLWVLYSNTASDGREFDSEKSVENTSILSNYDSERNEKFERSIFWTHQGQEWQPLISKIYLKMLENGNFEGFFQNRKLSKRSTYRVPDHFLRPSMVLKASTSILVQVPKQWKA